MVEYLINLLSKKYSIVVLSRGYGRETTGPAARDLAEVEEVVRHRERGGQEEQQQEEHVQRVHAPHQLLRLRLLILFLLDLVFARFTRRGAAHGTVPSGHGRSFRDEADARGRDAEVQAPP